MNSAFESIKVLCLVILTGLAVYMAVVELRTLKNDVRILRTYLMGLKTPVECGDLGDWTKSATNCQATVDIIEVMENGYAKVKVPMSVVEKQHQNCLDFKNNHPVYSQLYCAPPSEYTFKTWTLPITVAPDKKGTAQVLMKDQTWRIANDPSTKLMVALYQEPPPR